MANFSLHSMHRKEGRLKFPEVLNSYAVPGVDASVEPFLRSNSKFKNQGLTSTPCIQVDQNFLITSVKNNQK